MDVAIDHGFAQQLKSKLAVAAQVEVQLTDEIGVQLAQSLGEGSGGARRADDETPLWLDEPMRQHPRSRPGSHRADEHGDQENQHLRAPEGLSRDLDLEEPGEQRDQGRHLEQRWSLVQGRLVEQQLVAVVQAAELVHENGQDRHNRAARQQEAAPTNVRSDGDRNDRCQRIATGQRATEEQVALQDRRAPSDQRRPHPGLRSARRLPFPGAIREML